MEHLCRKQKLAGRASLAIFTILIGIFTALSGCQGFHIFNQGSDTTATTTPVQKLTSTKSVMLTPSSSLGIGSTQTMSKDGMVMVYVPAGEFSMGSADSDSQAQSNEKPQHKVYLDAFWIDRSEVTNWMYALCVQVGACREPLLTRSFYRHTYYDDEQFKDYPVIFVGWDDAKTYCKWAGRRLPTEAEWEKAARGTDGRSYPWGESIDCTKANYQDGKEGCVGDTAQVGSYPKGASPYGALDMAGNVWEWVEDYYGESYYENSPERNPTGPEEGDAHVLRGGSWNYFMAYSRCAFRFQNTANYRFADVGFRCALSAAQ